MGLGAGVGDRLGVGVALGAGVGDGFGVGDPVGLALALGVGETDPVAPGLGECFGLGDTLMFITEPPLGSVITPPPLQPAMPDAVTMQIHTAKMSALWLLTRCSPMNRSDARTRQRNHHIRLYTTRSMRALIKWAEW